MLVTKSWIEKKYNEFNKLYWEDKLPHNLNFKVNRSHRNWGMASYKFDYINDTIVPESITISNYYDSPESVKIQTLLHEMIHIADYFFYPERFFKNGRRISKRIYDPHGWWFNTEAKRISKASGYLISNRVTTMEMNASTLSQKSQRNIKAKQDKALICAVFGTNGIWYFKTDINKAQYLKNTLKKAYDWRLTIGDFKEVKFYKFNNPYLATRKSCSSRIVGWRTDKNRFIDYLKKIKGTEYII